MKTVKRTFGIFYCAVIIFVMLLPANLSVSAAAGPSLTTTLTDNTVQRGSKKTFDVWARNSAGEKIRATVKLNGKKVEPTWDDNEKTSYTLVFEKNGENTVTVSASSDGGKKKTLTYRITYKKAQPGEPIGNAVWSVELFTIGCGYLVKPVEVPVYEGETAAEQLVRLLHNSGYVGYYGGTVKSSFYLAYIADGTAAGAKYNNYQKSGVPANPKKLNLSPKIPEILIPHLKSTMTFYDPEDYKKNWSGYLGEFAFTNGSGWMYSVNNIFPNVGFADCYPSDGDVIRVQFTLGYGADIGGFGAMGTEIPDVENQPTAGYFAVADKDALTMAICKASAGDMSKAGVKKAYENALAVMAELNASQSRVDEAAKSLNSALSNTGGKSENNSSKSNNSTQNKTETAGSTHGGGEKAPSGSSPGAVSDAAVSEEDSAIISTDSADVKTENETGSNAEKKGNSRSVIPVVIITVAAAAAASAAVIVFIKPKIIKKTD